MISIGIVSLIGAAAFFAAGLFAGIQRGRQMQASSTAADRLRTEFHDEQRLAREQLERRLDDLYGKLEAIQQALPQRADANTAPAASTETSTTNPTESGELERLRQSEKKLVSHCEQLRQREEQLTAECGQLRVHMAESAADDRRRNSLRGESAELRREVGTLKQQLSDLKGENTLLKKARLEAIGDRDRAKAELRTRQKGE